jgi:transcriptional regulator with XRE-family HTH domain
MATVSQLENRQARIIRHVNAYRGEALGNEIMKIKETSDMTNAQIGAAAGISGSTVGQILSGSIACPPRRRLEGIADALNVSVARLITAAEKDGCSY